MISQGLSWFLDCFKNHPKCRTNDAIGGQIRLPTRLIEVEVSNGTLRARLRETATFITPVSYTTLSHCWGELDIWRLRQANYQQSLIELRLSLLPANFRDAMLVTALAKVRYIWIDSLCIVQDGGDWMK